MARPSKEADVLELFFNEQTKHWSFSELSKRTHLPDSKLAKWLARFRKDHLILRIKPEKKAPHYISNFSSPHFQNKKKLYAIARLYESGFLDHLASFEKTRLIVLFGSFARWDWYSGSDIDLFVYGDCRGLDYSGFEKKLGREIHVFACNDKAGLRKYSPGLLRNVIRGMVIRGDIPLEVFSHAAKDKSAAKENA